MRNSNLAETQSLKLKRDLLDCWSRDIAIALCLVIALVLIGFCSFFFTQDMITRISSRILLHCIFYKIKKLPEDGLTCCLKRRAIKGYTGLIEQLHKDVVIN